MAKTALLLPVSTSSDSPLIARDDSQSSVQSAGIDVAGEVFPPFLLAGIGMVVAGWLLSIVRFWDVFLDVNEIIVLVPALLGLKGNLEMTLASRMATHANLGELEGDAVFSIGLGNLALVQVQAISVGCLASIVATLLGALEGGVLDSSRVLVLSSSAVLASSTASLILASIMIVLVLFAHRRGIDPDNIASPIAGMLGDFCTLGLLACIAEILWETREEWWMLQVFILVFFCLVVPVCTNVAQECRHTSLILKQGWTPILLSMLISSAGGFILSHSVHYFKGLAFFAPVMNGAGGNLAAVQASRLSTGLHGIGPPGTPHEEPESEEEWEAKQRPVCKLRKLPCFRSLLGSADDARTARVLVFLAVPGSFLFVSITSSIKFGKFEEPGLSFLLSYEAAALFQVCLLMLAAKYLVVWLWRRGIDPDNAAIPYVTSLGDLLGSAILTFTFWVLTESGKNPFQDIQRKASLVGASNASMSLGGALNASATAP